MDHPNEVMVPARSAFRVSPRQRSASLSDLGFRQRMLQAEHSRSGTRLLTRSAEFTEVVVQALLEVSKFHRSKPQTLDR